jgi:hypothetical protein
MRYSWDSDHTKEAMRASAAVLGNFSDELQRKLADQAQPMTADEALLLLQQITGFAESMSDLAALARHK